MGLRILKLKWMFVAKIHQFQCFEGTCFWLGRCVPLSRASDFTSN